jgi:integrase
MPSLGQYLTTWLADVVRPSLEPATYTYYEAMARLYIAPELGHTRIDSLQVADVRAWLDKVAATCQCCAQGKDKARPAGSQRCCALNNCCQARPGRRTVQAARNTLRAALNHAMTSDELVTRNVAAYVNIPGRPARVPGSGSAWSADEASRFLASAREDSDPFYAAYVLILFNALRKGEALGLVWPGIDTDNRNLDISWQLQRVGGQLIHKQRTRHGSPSAEYVVPMPEICSAALSLRRQEQAAAKEQAGERWQASDLVFTTRWGTPVEPRNFNRSFEARCQKARVPRIRVHDTRNTCASLLIALDVHPGVVLRILRYAKNTMATETRTEVTDAMIRAALSKLSDSLDAAAPRPGDQR